MDHLLFEETAKIGLRKSTMLYFDDLIEDETILKLETILEQFLILSRTEFTKKRGGSDRVNIRNLRGCWKTVFHRGFDKRDQADSQCLTLENSSPQHLQTGRAVISLSNRSSNVYQELYFQWPVQTEWSILYNF